MGAIVSNNRVWLTGVLSTYQAAASIEIGGDTVAALLAIIRCLEDAPQSLGPAEHAVLTTATLQSVVHLLSRGGHLPINSDDRSFIVRLAGCSDLEAISQELNRLVSVTQTSTQPASPGPRAALAHAERAVEVIHRRCCDPALTLAAVSRDVGLSRSHLAHLLREVTGRTFLEHLHRERVLKARSLLETSDLNVKQVAYDVGYSATYRLDYHFKRVFGLLPTAVRKRGRQQ